MLVVSTKEKKQAEISVSVSDRVIRELDWAGDM